MNTRRIAEILIPWTNRHGLRISDIYRDQFWYIDIVDDTGGEYEISVFPDEQPDLIKVRVQSNRKRSCGFIGVVPSDLEGILEQAHSRIIQWTNQTGGTKIRAREW